MRTIEERMSQLERSNRRLKGALGVIVAAGLAGVLCAAGPEAPKESKDFDTIKVKNIFVLDEKGSVVAQLGSNESGGDVSILDSKGLPSISLRSLKTGPLIHLHPKNQIGDVMISVDDRGGGRIAMSDQNAKDTVAISASNGGRFQILTGGYVAGELTAENGVGKLNVRDAAGKTKTISP